MRSGYSDDLDQQDLAMWRGRVASAFRGGRGQKLLRDALAALDAMPEKRLIANQLVTPDGDVCLLGAAARTRGIAGLGELDPEEHDELADALDVAPCLIQEIEFVNDEMGPWGREETPEERWRRVRNWVVDHIHHAAPGQERGRGGEGERGAAETTS